MFWKFAILRKRTNKECFIVFVLENNQPMKKKPDGIESKLDQDTDLCIYGYHNKSDISKYTFNIQ